MKYFTSLSTIMLMLSLFYTAHVFLCSVYPPPKGALNTGTEYYQILCGFSFSLLLFMLRNCFVLSGVAAYLGE